MAEQPAVTAHGYCTNTAPVPGTIRTVNAKNTGPKYFHLHGRRSPPWTNTPRTPLPSPPSSASPTSSPSRCTPA
ncbi:hypothetical protein ACWDG1_49860, partial [Streptomyces sp. NPDC001177]